MRDYGRVYCSFWTSADVQSLSDDGRLLALYLLTGPHGTIAGVCRLPDGYLCEDMRWNTERVAKGLVELSRNGFADRCETTKWLWVRKFLEWNMPENPNQWKAARKIADQIPQQCAWRPEFLNAFAIAAGDEGMAESNASGTVPQRLRERLPTQEQEQKQEQEQEQDVARPATPPERNARERKRAASKATACPDPFLLTADLVAWARENTPAVEPTAETAKFIDHWRANRKTKNDWIAAWRNWMRKAQEIVNAHPSVRGAQSSIVTHEQREARELAQLKDRRKAIGLADFRDPRPNETAANYRRAQDTEWESRQSRSSAASLSSVAGSALRTMA